MFDEDRKRYEELQMRRDYAILKMNRMTAAMKAAAVVYGLLFGFVYLAFFIWPPIKSILIAKQDILQAEAEGYRKIPNLEQKILSVEKQMSSLTTENIEARLSTIEKAIAAGEIKPEDLTSLQQLREDFRIMKSYMFDTPEKLIDFKSLQRDYVELKGTAAKVMPKDTILREIDSVRNLFYATLTICGILVSIFAGAWFVAFRQRMKPIPIPDAQPEDSPDKK